MHELAITEAVVEGVSEQVGDARVTRVVLEIGRLSGVVPDAIRFCFDVCAQGTRLDGATLDIVVVPGRGRCRACRAETALEDALPLCSCGSADVELLAGRELRVREVEVI